MPGKAGKHGARKPQRAADKAYRAASLAALMHGARWPGRGFRDSAESLLGRTPRPEDPTAEEFDAALFPERGDSGLCSRSAETLGPCFGVTQGEDEDGEA